MEASSVQCSCQSLPLACQCRLHTLTCSEAGCTYCCDGYFLCVTNCTLLFPTRVSMLGCICLCLWLKVWSSCTSPALSCFGRRVPRHLEHYGSCQSSRTGEKMGTGRSRGGTMVRRCSNIPTPSVWLTSLSPGHRAL